jgi:hypothetical protein
VTFTQQVSSPVQLVFVPHGTCTMSYSGSGGNCTSSATSTSCEFDTDYRLPLTIDIDSSTDPPTYSYYGEISANVGLHVTQTCAGTTTVYDTTSYERLLDIPLEDPQIVAADGSLKGTRSDVQTPQGGTITDTWTWDLKLEIRPPRGPETVYSLTRLLARSRSASRRLPRSSRALETATISYPPARIATFASTSGGVPHRQDGDENVDGGEDSFREPDRRSWVPTAKELDRQERVLFGASRERPSLRQKVRHSGRTSSSVLVCPARAASSASMTPSLLRSRGSRRRRRPR